MKPSIADTLPLDPHATHFVMGPGSRWQLRALAKLAAPRPVDMSTLAQYLDVLESCDGHQAELSQQSVTISGAFLVVFAIECGHPGGLARHISISDALEGRIPPPKALWLVAEELGFAGASRT